MAHTILSAVNLKGKYHEENCYRTCCFRWRIVYRLRILPADRAIPLRTDYRWQADLRLRLLIYGGKRSSSPTAMLDKAVPSAASTPPFTGQVSTINLIFRGFEQPAPPINGGKLPRDWHIQLAC